MKQLVVFVGLLISCQLYSQQFTVELLDDTLLSGVANPQEPIIFHFEATNLTDSTYLVDFIRLQEVIPEGWETSLCTEACFPPNISEGIFFLDEMATDDISFYFYPSTPGMGSADLLFVNTVDENNTFLYTLYANALAVGIEDVDPVQSFILDHNNRQIILESREANQLRIFNLAGKMVQSFNLNVGKNQILIDELVHSVYIINLGNWSQKISLY